MLDLNLVTAKLAEDYDDVIVKLLSTAIEEYCKSPTYVDGLLEGLIERTGNDSMYSDSEYPYVLFYERYGAEETINFDNEEEVINYFNNNGGDWARELHNNTDSFLNFMDELFDNFDFDNIEYSIDELRQHISCRVDDAVTYELYGVF